MASPWPDLQVAARRQGGFWFQDRNEDVREEDDKKREHNVRAAVKQPFSAVSFIRQSDTAIYQ